MVLASLALVLLAPILLMVAGLVRVVMGGPAIFAHKRVGFDGRTFFCYKFRTMLVNGEEVLRRHLATDPDAAKEWRERLRLRNDPSVDCLGNILRKSSLAELPQLFNVLRGHMKLCWPPAGHERRTRPLWSPCRPLSQSTPWPHRSIPSEP